MDIIFEKECYTRTDDLYHSSYILLDAELVSLSCKENMEVRLRPKALIDTEVILTGKITVTATFKDKFNNEDSIEIATLKEDYDSKHFDIIKDYTETMRYFINVNRTKTITEKDIIFFCRASLEYEPTCDQGKYKYAETVKDIVEEV